ncbi:hypothetical protein L21SP3_01148 [Sedimentisphaera cyanobacteriorum]|uniref:Polymerase beta nucleotidyltransferase domain-containing protein n=1 Tax=Sedimentisphaera cyanobacteriorum TaxID=1940790 RepID=A0A1Q2HPY1_9BACT|nr:hypothetical protein [Sedimentisphaera cyanobacteriorum]AQQ09344.1 hypothetical protein L21SP3_01148 [Sedimentisphaera cyanobacteriorum]
MNKITIEQLNTIKGIFQKNLPGSEIRFFAEGESLPELSPGLDLVLMGDSEPDKKILKQIKKELADQMPFSVDICIWAKLPDELRQAMIKKIKKI